MHDENLRNLIRSSNVDHVRAALSRPGPDSRETPHTDTRSRAASAVPTAPQEIPSRAARLRARWQPPGGQAPLAVSERRLLTKIFVRRRWRARGVKSSPARVVVTWVSGQGAAGANCTHQKSAAAALSAAQLHHSFVDMKGRVAPAGTPGRQHHRRPSKNHRRSPRGHNGPPAARSARGLRRHEVC